MAFTSNQQDLKESTVSRTSVLEAFRDYHQDLIDDLGISRTDFNIKRGFYDKAGRYVVGIYNSEFTKPNGLYFEVVERDYTPADPKRTVYKLSNNPHYEQEYELNERGTYLVPIEELRVVNPMAVAISGPSAVTAGEKTAKTFTPPTKIMDKPIPPYRESVVEDEAYSEMTIRDYFAIHTGRPVSNKGWLNELIKQNT